MEWLVSVLPLLLQFHDISLDEHGYDVSVLQHDADVRSHDEHVIHLTSQ